MPIMRNYRGSRGGSQANKAAFSFLLISLTLLFLAFSQVSRADELEKVTDELNNTKKKRNEISSRIDQYKKDLSATQAELAQLQADIDSVRASLVNINKNLEIRRADLKEKFQLRDRIVRAQYQSGRLTDLE